MSYSYDEFIPIIKAIADDTRLKIIDMLSCGDMCANDILEAFKISQSTLSYHMKILTEAGIINGVKDGSWMRYTLNYKKADRLIDFLRVVTREKEDCICKNIQCKKE